MIRIIALTLLLSAAQGASIAQNLKIAKLKYNGGGDWYANKTALPNLIAYCNATIKTNIAAEEASLISFGIPGAS